MTEYMVIVWRESRDGRPVIWYRGPSRHASMIAALVWAQDWIAGVSDVCKVSIEVAR